MEVVLAGLRSAIERRQFAVGDKLPSEAALSAEFEVSRSVIREALRGLQALGLTVSHPGKGTFVAAGGPAQNPVFGDYPTRDLLEVRRHVEIPVAGYAAIRRTSDDLDVLERLLHRMAGETDDTAWVALDTLFHITVAQASGNPVFGKVIAEIRDALSRQSAFLNQLGDRREQSNVEHHDIVAAIADRNEDAAVGAMNTHLTKVERTLTTIVRPEAHQISGEDPT
ncbi:GntR family transcriptional regulator [Amycolatopsis antarctica]|uniref:GntR family transcriptional regulator n=1 Tax=Amycolatopsis antarctica TaxID=1854586 RepID=A0A263D0Y2_9PSEU|nr:FadR/GntR family transcriptional regulator [Amycolatopsis antarctica]OZM72093.1 GntR family transcriptional regulator [Amycolatopsis antarctica]